MPSSTGMVERRVTALETPSIAALNRVLSQIMFNLRSLLCLDSGSQVLCPWNWFQNRLMYIELVVVTVVGGGEDVEKSERDWNDAGFWFSTGL